MKFIFLPADKRQRFLLRITNLLFLCNISRKSVKVDFLHVDKFEGFLQIDSMILMGMIKDSQSSQKSKFAMSLQYLKKEIRYKVD